MYVRVILVGLRVKQGLVQERRPVSRFPRQERLAGNVAVRKLTSPQVVSLDGWSTSRMHPLLSRKSELETEQCLPMSR